MLPAESHLSCRSGVLRENKAAGGEQIQLFAAAEATKKDATDTTKTKLKVHQEKLLWEQQNTWLRGKLIKLRVQ
jgi:hypothetical protein